MSTQLRVGVVGLGIWGRNHAALYANYHRSKLSVVCDTDAERAQAIARKYGCRWTTDVRETAQQCDAIAVATPDFAHTEAALSAIAAGKHVIIEKPLATSTHEAVDVWEAADSAGVVAMVDFHLRWSPDYLMISDAIRHGDLGALYMAYIRISNALVVAQRWLPWSNRSGPEWFLLPHILDLMVWLLEETPKSVFARGVTDIVGGRENHLDALQASFQFERAFVTVETSWAVPSSVPWVVDSDFALYGSKGRVHFKPSDRNLSVATAERYFWPVPGEDPDRYGRLSSWIYDPMRYWVDTCLGLVPPTSTIADGVRNTALVAAVLEAIKARREVTIEVPELKRRSSTSATMATSAR